MRRMTMLSTWVGKILGSKNAGQLSSCARDFDGTNTV